MEQRPRRFNLRACVALMIAVSGLGLPVTGVFNHLHGLESMTLGRHAWMAAHNVLGILFVLFSIVHVVLNRRALWSHLRNTAARLPTLSREALVAGAIVAVVLAVSVGHAFHAGGHG